MLGARQPFGVPPFFWSNHFDLQIRYVGYGSGGDRAMVSGDLNARDASVIFHAGDKLTAVASLGRDLENLKAELALERGRCIPVGRRDMTVVIRSLDWRVLEGRPPRMRARRP